MARGALLPMAEAIGKEIDLSGASPTFDRNSDAGRRHGIFDMSQFQFPQYLVTIDVEEVNGWLWEKNPTLWNERIGRLVTAGPWGAFEAGRRAFIDYLRANLKQAIPSILKYRTATHG